MELNVKGCQNLLIAIYEQAANDYIAALVMNDKYRMKTIEKFWLSGRYEMKEEVGKYLITTCKKEVYLAKKTIDSFLLSDSEKLLINREDISINVLRIVIDFGYSTKCELKCDYHNHNKRNKYFLCRK